jgi:hypothetical protein
MTKSANEAPKKLPDDRYVLRIMKVMDHVKRSYIPRKKPIVGFRATRPRKPQRIGSGVDE